MSPGNASATAKEANVTIASMTKLPCLAGHPPASHGGSMPKKWVGANVTHVTQGFDCARGCDLLRGDTDQVDKKRDRQTEAAPNAPMPWIAI